MICERWGENKFFLSVLIYRYRYNYNDTFIDISVFNTFDSFMTSNCFRTTQARNVTVEKHEFEQSTLGRFSTQGARPITNIGNYMFINNSITIIQSHRGRRSALKPTYTHGDLLGPKDRYRRIYIFFSACKGNSGFRKPRVFHSARHSACRAYG